MHIGSKCVKVTHEKTSITSFLQLKNHNYTGVLPVLVN